MANTTAQEKEKIDGERFMTRQEVADLFRITTKTVDRWEGKGVFHPLKAGRFKLYERTEVLSVLDSMAGEDGRFKFGKDGRLIDVSMSANCE